MWKWLAQRCSEAFLKNSLGKNGVWKTPGGWWFGSSRVNLWPTAHIAVIVCWHGRKMNQNIERNARIYVMLMRVTIALVALCSWWATWSTCSTLLYEMITAIRTKRRRRMLGISPKFRYPCTIRDCIDQDLLPTVYVLPLSCWHGRKKWIIQKSRIGFLQCGREGTIAMSLSREMVLIRLSEQASLTWASIFPWSVERLATILRWVTAV